MELIISGGIFRVVDKRDAVRVQIPKETLFLTGKIYFTCRERKRIKRYSLPDFFIGVHAVVDKWEWVTRDTSRYKP